MTKESPKVNGKVKKAAAARQAKGGTEQENRESERKRRERLKERRADLKRKQGQILTEAEVRQSLHSYYVYLLDDGLDEDSALSEVHKHTGISKNVLDEAIVQWESTRTLRCVDGANRALARKGKGKAPAGTNEFLKRYVDRENQSGRSVTAAECRRYLASEPDPEDAFEASRIPVQVSHQTTRTWLHDLGYSYVESRKGFALKGSA